MRITTLVIAGVVLSLLAIIIVGSKIENGDVNAASMYLVVFAMPTIMVILLNGLFLAVVRNAKSKPIIIVLCFLPILLLILLSFKNDLTFGGIDGNLVFVARIAAVVVGVTNVLWAVKFLKVSE